MRVLLLGLDGYGHGLMNDMIAMGELPRIAALASSGASRLMQSPPPTSTIPSWTNILTGVNPGRHGLYDFTRRDGYSIRFAGGQNREAPNVFEILSALGKSVVAVGYPGTFPAVKVRGAMLAGLDSPAAVRGRPEGCHPTALHDVLVENFGTGYLPFDTLDDVQNTASWYRNATSKLVESIGRRIELSMFLVEQLRTSPPDLLAVHFPEADTAGHHFWHLHDLNSPRSPEWLPSYLDDRTGRVADPLARIYSALDGAVGELIDRFQPDVTIVVSDHGMGGNGTRLVSLNRLLQQEGFLHTTPGVGATASRLLGAVKDLGLEVVGSELRDEIVGSVGSLLAGTMASKIRFGGIEWTRTAAFSEDLIYAPSIYLNQLSRDPEGMVHEKERTWWMQMVVDALESWKVEPPAGVMEPGPHPVVRKVHLREELFSGPHLDRLPDLIVELALDGNTTFSLQPGIFRTMDSAVEVLPETLMQGSTGKSKPGSHRSDGIFIASPTSDEGSACDLSLLGSIQQTSIAPLLLELVGFRAPGYFDTEPDRVTDGKLEWIDERFLIEAWQSARESKHTEHSAEDERAVGKRLEDLGFI